MPPPSPPSPTSSLKSIKLTPPRAPRIPKGMASPAIDMFQATTTSPGKSNRKKGFFIEAVPTKCHYTTQVHTCSHTSPLSYPRITHTSSCAGPSKMKDGKRGKARLSIGGMGLCDNMAGKPVLKYVETECSECRQASRVEEEEREKKKKKKLQQAKESGIDTEKEKWEEEWEIIEKKNVGRGLEPPSRLEKVKDLSVRRFLDGMGMGIGVGGAWS